LLRLDGPWWTHRQLDYLEHDVCEHFILLSGAINFSKKQRNFTWTRDVYPGPDKPFILPRLLTHPATIAVINQFTVAGIHSAYPVLYFSKSLPAKEVKHHSWGSHAFVPGLSDEPWEFNLTPWLENETLLWIEPGDHEFNLCKRESSHYHQFTSMFGSDQKIREGRLENLQALDHSDLHWD
jgi:hypothetical protein